MERVRDRNDGGKYRIAILGRTHKALAPVAEALREAAISFRAVDLEGLAGRPEIMDALAMARALFNPQDRVNWLGVLRAPWCGLSLEDLHKVAGDGEDLNLLKRPIPELLAERTGLLSEAGQRSASRLLEAFASATAVRAAHPTAAVGTWLEQVWLRLGGDGCVDATARANLEMLWGCLDRLPDGEQDLLGPALDAALKTLTALPDVDAECDFGVQLMTIHKAKGLEFEVVIVPELQARCARNSRKMLSWLERGLPSPDDSGEITEFLVAPIPSKGADRGRAKKWVDDVRQQRERQEDRRILYVAATRAREELHFFACPAYRIGADGSPALCEPSNSLLATAWPALEDEVRARFEDWKAAHTKEEAKIESIAASGETNLLAMPRLAKPAILRRLRPDYSFPDGAALEPDSKVPGVVGMSSSALYARHEGGLASRALGIAVHAFLEELARLRATSDWIAARAALGGVEPRIAAQIRSSGIEAPTAADLAAEALRYALDASETRLGEWILSPHAGAGSELRWAGMVADGLRTVRVDRVFRAGLEPLSDGEGAWWIIDYKTAHAENADPASALPQLRKLFAPQLEAYAQVLRNLQGADSVVRAGLYYPRMLLLDWWQI